MFALGKQTLLKRRPSTCFSMTPPQATKTLAQRLAPKGHAPDMGEAPLHSGQEIFPKERGTHKESRSADFLKEKYDILTDTISILKVAL